MIPIRSLALSLVPFVSLAAHALTLVSLAEDPSTTPNARTTPIGTFFNSTVAVRVLEDGVPQAGVAVTFTATSAPVVGFVEGSTVGLSAIALTDADGIAAIDDGLLAVAEGDTDLVASARDASVTLPGYRVTAGGAVRVEIVSGEHQVVVADTPFCEPLVVRALDASGAPVARAAVEFSDLLGSGARFGGESRVLVRAGEAGVAASPVPTAGAERGRFELFAQPLRTGSVEFALYRFVTLPARAGYSCR